MSNQNPQSKIPSAPPRNRPAAPGTSPELTEEQKQEKRQEIINSAPLRSSENDTTNPTAVTPPEKPWRDGMNLPAEQLMQIRSKTSLNQPQEHVLRLAFLAAEKNKTRGFGPKVYVSDLINEAIERYTRDELKKLGHDTK